MECQSGAWPGAAPASVAACDISACPLGVSWPRFSREGRPEGSLPPFGWGDIAWRLNPYPVDYRPAFAFSLVLYPPPHGLLSRVAFPCGETTGLPRSADVPGWGGAQLFAGGAVSPAGELRAPGPAHVPFGSSVIASFACWS